MASQDDLRALWLEAPEGKLCGREQALIFAFADRIEIDIASDLKDFPHISLGLAGMFLGLLRVYIRTHT